MIKQIFHSSLGKKFIMALTGLALFGFVIGHLVGNLQVFLGAESINSYGHFLKSKPGLIWGARIGLLACVLLHIWSAVRLSAENKAARPIGYDGNPNPVVASYASRTMLMSGLIVLSFIIYHLLHFTVLVQAVNFTGRDFAVLKDVRGYHDISQMMILGFSKPLVSFFYLLSIGLLSLHLSHGLSALFQTLGLKNKTYAPLIDNAARLFAVLIFAGYASMPLAVLTGLLK